MGTKVQRDFVFQAGLHFKNKMLMNIYTLGITFYVETNFPEEQSIAMDRIKYFLYDCLEHSIFVDETETEVIEKYLTAGLNVCTLPNLPYDQIVMTALLLKFNAITENRFSITDIVLGSKMSDGVRFFGDIDTIDECFNKQGWYNEPNTNFSDYKRKFSKNGKVVKLVVNNYDWEKSLKWMEKTPSEILFTKDTTYPNN